MISAIILAAAFLLSAEPAHAEEVREQASAANQVVGVKSAADADVRRRPLGHSASTYTFGVGTFTPSYVPPAAGSYELPPIDTIHDHPLVDAAGKPITFSKAIGDRFAVVSFIYGSCAEATGCPMSTAALYRLDEHLSGESTLTGEVALVTISFDPERDGPERLMQMQNQRVKGSTWQFLTADSQSSLATLLADFGQTISRLNYPDGEWTGVYRHVLKVFLLDRQRRVRNVYSVGYLQPELVRNDLETLRLAEPR